MTCSRLAQRGLGALGAIAVLAAGASAARAQGVGAGATLELPGLGVKIGVPAGIGEWIVRLDDGGDVVQRTRPVNPYLSVLFSVPEGKRGDCNDTMAGFAKKGLKKLDRPSLVPAGWSTQVLTASSSGEHLVALCAENADGRQLLALVTYAATVEGPDLDSITPILEVVGKATFARPKEAPAPAAAAPPAAPPEAEEEAQRLVLPRSGLVLLVGGDAEWEARPGKGGRDLIRRTRPDDPALSVALELVRSAHDEEDRGCEAILDQYLATRSKASLEAKPSYLPDDFHPSVAQSYDRGAGRALTCAAVPSGYLLATIAYAGSLDAEDAHAVRPVLAAAYLAANGLGATRKAGHAPPSGHSFYSPAIYLAGQRLGPHDASNPAGRVDDGTGILVGVRQAGMLPFGEGAIFGLAGRYQLGGGWDSQNDLFFDGLVAIGLGISVDRVLLMPMVGGGGDAIGAGAKRADDKLNMPFELFTYYGGVAVVELTSLLALQLSGGYCERGDVRELRYDGEVIALPHGFRKLSLGVSYVDISTVSTTWQLVLGMGF